MSARALILFRAGVFVLALSPRASAEDFDVRADLHAGVATAPFFSTSLPEAGGHGLALVAGGAWHATPDVALGLSVPLAATTVRQPSGSHVDEAAWGNPMAWAEGSAPVVERETFRALVRWRAGVGAPLAGSGSPAMLHENRALAIADALTGWRERELYAPGVVPAAVTAGLDLEGSRFRGEARVKLVSLVRIDDADLPRGTTNPFGLTSTFALGGAVSLTRVVGVGTRVYLVADVLPQADSPRARTLQWVLAPLVAFRFGPHVALETELVAPVGGALGGDTFALGLRATAGF